MSDNAATAINDFGTETALAQGAVNDFVGLAADVGEFLADEDVKNFAAKASRIAKGLGFVGAAFGIVFDIAQMMDPNFKSDTDQVLGAIEELGTKIDDLQVHIDQLFEQLKKDISISTWKIQVSEDVMYVQRAIRRMHEYNQEVKAWQEAVGKSQDPPQVSESLQEAIDNMRRIDGETLLGALESMKAASAGVKSQQLEGLLELLYPDQRGVVLSFVSTISHLSQGSDAFCLLNYLERMQGLKRESTAEFKQKSADMATEAQQYAEQECVHLVDAVVNEYQRLLVEKYPTVYYGQQINLHLPDWGGGVQLTGGRKGDVYAKVKHIQPGEVWKILNASDTARTGPVHYNDEIVLYQPWRNVYLTGGHKGDVYSRTKNLQPGEKWRIQRISDRGALGPVMENERVVLYQPWRSVFLTGWDTLVYAYVKHIKEGENWQIQKLDR
jgi:hypothetical protein